MMPDLGKYAAEVLSAYAVTIALMTGLVAISLLQSVRTRKALRDVEAARKAARADATAGSAIGEAAEDG